MLQSARGKKSLSARNGKAAHGDPERRKSNRPWSKRMAAKSAGHDARWSAGFAEECPEPILRVSPEGRVLFVNDPANFLLCFWQVGLGDTLPSPWPGTLGALFAGTEMISAVEMECEGRVFALTLQPVRAQGYINIWGRDATAARRAEAEVQRVVHHDPLTGLPNRTLFLDRLEQTVLQARRARTQAAVHLVNLDFFKEINDTAGHAIGDGILKAMAERLLATVRDTDTVAHLGSDEFAVIQGELRETDGADVLARKILEAFKPPLAVDGQVHKCSITVGVSLFPDDGQDAPELLRHADLALFHAKKEERGGYRFYTAKMNETLQRRRSIEQDLSGALDRQEFVLHYQPKMNARTGEVCGMEALIRWRHPEKGFVSPGDFIPVAERSRLIIPIGEWSLFEACRRTKAWHDAGLPKAKAAVNLSAVQLRDKSLVESVTWILDGTGLAPEFLELEITESVAMRDVDETIRLFKQLADLGVSLSIDDFGTGYSSLSYLKRFPVKRIKIDRTFVSDIGTDPTSGAIARAVTTLGHGFGMEITAEGIETREQLEFLIDIGVDEIQGYFFSKPLGAEDFAKFVGAPDPRHPAIEVVRGRQSRIDADIAG
jgi:diguanylate cyclase (GGDEF)-like protein